jgi:hypothetical protein
MHKPTKHLFGVGLLALAATQLLPTAAQACIKFDRAAEMAVINRAIAAPRTASRTKTALLELRQQLSVIQKKEIWKGDDVSRHGELVRKALGLLGKQRIIYRGPVEQEAGGIYPVKSRSAVVAKTVVKTPTKIATRAAGPGEDLGPGCG